MNPLTDRQREVLRTIDDLTKRLGFAPTVRELGDELEIASTKGVADHLDALEAKGCVSRRPHMARTLVLTERGRREIQ